ncbi:hypothetical protein HJ01_01553 [Flavobacterium frigoris PS1]|uniref:Uncharacterized protein n=1 Tax=Flavobacterium frigoris (strain PS1) TaxID=1086011 RepID=H7FQN7_FLAFP|nr:hypothetical protein HJ01_01553 [Flavobacterium frigoris PS1]
MLKKNIIIGLVTFIIGFGVTFYIIRTYFPKHKVEKTTTTVEDTITKPQ